MRQKGEVAFIDFSEHNLDQDVEICPSVPSRPFWHRAYQVALDDLADLITPEHIVVCEGATTRLTKALMQRVTTTCLPNLPKHAVRIAWKRQ